MTRARGRALLILGILGVAIVAAMALVATPYERPPAPLPPRAPSERPALLLLTSLPLLFGDDFSLQQTGSPAMKALEERYRVVPISVADAAELGKGRLLLMAHPLAQPAEDLIALDKWVRGGGRMLLLADPMLEWPSERALGDRLRPPLMFMDTGLLAHWGLRLDAPEQRGPRREQARRLRRRDSIRRAIVRLVQDRPLTGWSRIASSVRANTVVADADLLDVARLGARAKHNLDGILAELASLELGDSVTNRLIHRPERALHDMTLGRDSLKEPRKSAIFHYFPSYPIKTHCVP